MSCKIRKAFNGHHSSIVSRKQESLINFIKNTVDPSAKLKTGKFSPNKGKKANSELNVSLVSENFIKITIYTSKGFQDIHWISNNLTPGKFGIIRSELLKIFN